MKKHLLIISTGILLTACSGSQQVTISNYDPNNNPYYIKKTKEYTSTNEAFDTENKVHEKINTIIEKYLGVSITSVARSKITKTDTGYQWKFMNVKTGANFSAYSDFNFSSVNIIKNQKS